MNIECLLEIWKLEDWWFPLWKKVSSIDPKPSFRDIILKYCEPHRKYHNVLHIGQMVTELNKIRDKFNCDLKPIEFAIFFHDVIFDTYQVINEAESVKYMREICENGNIAKEFIDNVECLILNTTHKTIPTKLDEQILSDLDLSILGSFEDKFKKYNQSIRQEYYWVDEILYLKTRTLLLQKFLNRSHIYQISYFREKWEAQARMNLKKIIESFVQKITAYNSMEYKK